MPSSVSDSARALKDSVSDSARALKACFRFCASSLGLVLFQILPELSMPRSVSDSARALGLCFRFTKQCIIERALSRRGKK